MKKRHEVLVIFFYSRQTNIFWSSNWLGKQSGHADVERNILNPDRLFPKALFSQGTEILTQNPYFKLDW